MALLLDPRPVDEDWMDYAACLDQAPVMDPELLEDVKPAKRVCRPCPVKARCLTAALKVGAETMVWGGFTFKERERLAAGRRAVLCPRCRLLGVPRHPNQAQCDACQAKFPTPIPDVNADDLAQIKALAMAGRSDPQIAESLGVETDKVKYARLFAGIPSGKVNRTQPCGTPAAARRHTRAGEVMCPMCRQALREYQLTWRAASRG